MSTIAIVTGIFFMLMLGFSIGIPFIAERQRRLVADQQAKSVTMLEDQLMRLIHAVHDLDLDFDMGKVTEEDYIMNRKLLIGRGVSTLIRLDDARQSEHAVDLEIEKLVAAYRQNG